MVGALIGTWLGYALVRLHSAPGRRSFTVREGLVVVPPVLGSTAWIIAVHPGVAWDWGGGLGWDEVLLFLLAPVLVRCAIGVASIAQVRGGLVLAFGMPIICSGLGYAFVTIFRPPPVGHPCPSSASASACVYHPLIGERSLDHSRSPGRPVAGICRRSRSCRIAAAGPDLDRVRDRAARTNGGDRVGSRYWP